jgi:hypothetical protein
MAMTGLILKRASIGANQDDYDVLVDDKVVGCTFRAAHSPRGTAWMWTLACGEHEERTPTRGLRTDARSRDGGVR